VLGTVNAIENKLEKTGGKQAQGPLLKLPAGVDAQKVLEESRQREALALQWSTAYSAAAQNAADQAVEAQMAEDEATKAQADSYNAWALYYKQHAQLCASGHLPTAAEQVTYYSSTGQPVPEELQQSPATEESTQPLPVGVSSVPEAGVAPYATGQYGQNPYAAWLAQGAGAPPMTAEEEQQVTLQAIAAALQSADQSGNKPAKRAK
jgi:hypothetical protein